MKAYIVEIKNYEEVGNEIVFAQNTKEARKQAYYCDIAEDYAERYIDICVRRYPAFDNMEKLSECELLMQKWRYGWWFSDEWNCPDPDTTTNEEFLNWYKNNY